MKNSKIIFLLGATIALLAGCQTTTSSSTNPSKPSSSETPVSSSEAESSSAPAPVSSSSAEPISSSSESSKSSEPSSSSSIDTRPDYEKGELKDVNGEGLLFTETVGYSTKDASIFEEEGVRYITYVDNETRNGERIFAARKGELVGGKWVYGERYVVFHGNHEEDAWDKYIYQPSIVKGHFTKGETEYKYLMLYHANDTGTDRNNSIGFAVSNNVLGEWERITDEPLIANPEIYEACYGFGSPSVVSYNHGGLVIVSYSYGENLISGSRVKFVNFADLDDIQVEPGYADITNKGLLYREDGVISNAGIAVFGNDVMLINDNMPDGSAPGCSTSLELAVAPQSIIMDAGESWLSLKKISGFDTMGDETLGWDEMYSGDFVTDAYGAVIVNEGVFEICYSTYNVEAANPSQTAQLCIYSYVNEE